MRRPIATVLVLAAATAAGAVAAPGRDATAGCTGGQLGGSFAAVPDSAGAGNIVYRLTLRNRSNRSCTVRGLPAVTLLRANGRPLPTHVIPDGTLATPFPLLVVRPGHSASATARFSPDIPGTGEPITGPCEPKAFKLAVKPPGGGRVVVSVSPATSVCEHGQLQFRALHF